MDADFAALYNAPDYVAPDALKAKRQAGGGGGGMGDPSQMMGMFADGGTPPVGQPSIVGENGPELFVPKQLGTIVPNPNTAAVPGALPQITPGIHKPDPAPAPGGFGSLGGLPPLSSVGTSGMGGLRPIVTNPREQREERMQSALDKYDEQFNLHGGFWSKLGQVMKRPYLNAERPAMDDYAKQLAGLQGQDLAEQDAASKRELQASQQQFQQAHAEEVTPVELSLDQAIALGHPELTGIHFTPQQMVQMEKVWATNDTKESTTQENIAGRSEVGDAKNQTTLQVAGIHTKMAKEIADAHNKTQLLIKQMGDATSRSNTADRVLASGAKGSAGGGMGKVPMAVTNRAALSTNVVENANEVEKIISAHPNIIGASGGRYSNVQQMIGSDDPNIQALGVRIHNIALASNGAHGLRSDRAIKGTEDAIFSHFHAGPNALRGALEAQKNSVGTFLQDEQNFQKTGNRTGATPSDGGQNTNAPKAGTVESGYRFKGGDPAQQSNWEKVK